MPETPDFDQLALNLVGWLLDRHAIPVDVQSKAQEQNAMAAQLRHVWNARGAADTAKIEASLTGSDWHVKQLDRALRELDR